MRKKQEGKRDLFEELMGSVREMALHREGKITLRTHRVTLPAVEESPGAEFFVGAREKFNVSRAVWADMLRVSPRTVEKWEQGGQGSPLAATFVDLVVRYPDTIERLRTLPKRVPKTPRVRADRVKPDRAKPTGTNAAASTKRGSKAKAISA